MVSYLNTLLHSSYVICNQRTSYNLKAKQSAEAINIKFYSYILYSDNMSSPTQRYSPLPPMPTHSDEDQFDYHYILEIEGKKK